MITFALATLAILTLAATAALVHAWKHAPEGHETELGFFAGRESGATPAPQAAFHCEQAGTGRAA